MVCKKDGGTRHNFAARTECYRQKYHGNGDVKLDGPLDDWPPDWKCDLCDAKVCFGAVHPTVCFQCRLAMP